MGPETLPTPRIMMPEGPSKPRGRLKKNRKEIQSTMSQRNDVNDRITVNGQKRASSLPPPRMQLHQHQPKVPAISPGLTPREIPDMSEEILDRLNARGKRFLRGSRGREVLPDERYPIPVSADEACREPPAPPPESTAYGRGILRSSTALSALDPVGRDETWKKPPIPPSKPSLHKCEIERSSAAFSGLEVAAPPNQPKTTALGEQVEVEVPEPARSSGEQRGRKYVHHHYTHHHHYYPSSTQHTPSRQLQQRFTSESSPQQSSTEQYPKREVSSSLPRSLRHQQRFLVVTRPTRGGELREVQSPSFTRCRPPTAEGEVEHVHLHVYIPASPASETSETSEIDGVSGTQAKTVGAGRESKCERPRGMERTISANPWRWRHPYLREANKRSDSLR